MNYSVVHGKNFNVFVEGHGAVECTGRVVQSEFGHLSLELDMLIEIENLMSFPDGQTICGKTDDGMSIAAEGCFKNLLIDPTPTSPAIVCFSPIEVQLTNTTLAFQWDRIDAYLKSPFFQDGSDEIRDDTRTLVIHPSDYSLGKGKITTKISILENALSIYDPEEIFQEYMLLLSMSQRSKIFAPRRETWNGDKLIKVQLFPNDMQTQMSHPLIKTDKTSISTFLSSSMAKFRAKKTDYDLVRLAEYYCMAYEGTYIEQRFLYASVFMEAFKFFWGKNLSGMRIINTSSGSIRGFADHSAPTKELSFKTLLDRAALSIGCNCDFTFIDERNAMFHSGSSRSAQAGAPRSYPSLRPHTWKMYRQMDDIILRLLEYSGDIIPYDNPTIIEKFPSSGRI